MGEVPLRIYVAMPGTSGGRGLFDAVAERLAGKLDRPVEIETHAAALREAAEADVCIADLTGADPNVYLELGARWALCDGITILVCQNAGQAEPLPFGISPNRVLSYGPSPDESESAIDAIVASVLRAMRDPGWIDSPVRTSLEVLTTPRSQWEGLRDQLRHMRESHADELVAVARDVPPARAIELLRRAIECNEVSFQAHYQLGVVLLRVGDYSGAISELSTATALKSDFAKGWRDLGLALSKSGELVSAEAAFHRAADIDPDDAETWSNLGGLRRRLARASGDGKLDWAMLREAKSAYQRACEIVGNDTYPHVNVARLDLVLSAHTPSTRHSALASLRRLEHLARFEAETAKQPGGDTEQKPWKVLDLADTLLLTGRVEEGLAELREAIDLIDSRSREMYLTSVIEPLRDLINVNVLDEPTAAGVRKAIDICKDAINEVRPRTGPRKPPARDSAELTSPELTSPELTRN